MSCSFRSRRRNNCQVPSSFCNITIKDYTPCPPKCYNVWVPAKYSWECRRTIPGHYIVICNDSDSEPHPLPETTPPLIGGCAGTRYGCCSDGITSKVDSVGSNCPQQPLIGGCAGTRYGCCSDGITSKVDSVGSNCVKRPCLNTCPRICNPECFHYQLRRNNGFS